MGILVEPSADVAPDAQLGDGSRVWHLAQVRELAVLGRQCTVGRGAYVGAGVRMGDNCKLQNYALVYEPAVLGRGSVRRSGRGLDKRPVPPRRHPRRGRERRRGLASGRSHCQRRRLDRCPCRMRRAGDHRCAGRWSPRAPSSSATSQTSRWSPALRPGGSDGWGGLGSPWTTSAVDTWRCPRTGETYVEQDGVLTVEHLRAGGRRRAEA